jgi:cell division protein FtsW (lipid II flippase)
VGTVRKESQTDWWRLGKLAVAIGVSGAVGYFFQPMVANNTDAVNTVVTIFSILAGFLIAVITLIAEPTLKQAKNWQELQLMKQTVQRKLFRQKLLFFLYLITLGVALGTFLVPDAQAELRRWLETVFLGLATFVFLASFDLPGSLMKIQMERYEAEMDATKPQVLKDAAKAAADAVKKADAPK